MSKNWVLAAKIVPIYHKNLKNLKRNWANFPKNLKNLIGRKEGSWDFCGRPPPQILGTPIHILNTVNIPLIGSSPGRLLGVLCLEDLNLGLDLAMAHTCKHVLPHESLSLSRAITQSSQVGVLKCFQLNRGLVGIHLWLIDSFSHSCISHSCRSPIPTHMCGDRTRWLCRQAFY